MKRVIAFSVHGPFLSTRHLGMNVRKDILNALKDEPPVTLDFAGVEGMSQSFADECIGKLAAELGKAKFKKNLRFKSVSPEVRPLLRHATIQRLREVQLAV